MSCKKLVALVLCLVLLVFSLSMPICAAPPSLSAASAILIDADSGRILFEKDAQDERPMASTTKIMTGLVALSLADPCTKIRVPAGAVGIEGSSAYLKEGELYTLEELLYALLLQSANDAASAIAIALSGSVEAFVAEMNRKAEELGLAHTHFETPSGLDGDSHYTTAYDLAMLTRVALQNPVFAKIVSTKRFLIPATEDHVARSFANHNKLLFSYPGCIGVKTGFTKKSGRCLVSAATREGVALIAVTLDAPDDWSDHKELLEYGFSNLQQKIICNQGDPVTEIPLVGGIEESISLEPETTLALTLPKDIEQLQIVYDLPPFAYAPLSRGERVGDLLVYEIGENEPPTLIGSVPLLASKDAAAKPKQSFFSKLRSFLQTLFRKEATP